MGFGSWRLQARKKRGMNQEELATMLGTKGPAIGRYERDEIKPSIEAATKMANILEVCLYWLVCNTDAEFDTATLNRIQDITKLTPKDKELSLSCLIRLSPIEKLKAHC